jgi:hypothetical protein
VRAGLFEAAQGGVAVMLLYTGLRMAFRPTLYVGVGTMPASDPRTVRSFGIFFALLGLIIASFLAVSVFLPE